MTILVERFRAMGCRAEVMVVDGDASMLAAARSTIEHLERCWSRFLPASDLTRLNIAGGRPTAVDPATVHLLVAMAHGHRITNGVFDPTVAHPLVGRRGDEGCAAEAGVRGGDMTGVLVDVATSTVTAPPGTLFDAGAIGKGLAADLVAEQLLELGGRGAMVNLGGDLRVAGSAPGDGGWCIAVGGERESDDAVAALQLGDGGVATSGLTRRHWTDRHGGAHHHVVDPATGAPLDGRVVQATVVAVTAMWAEVLATALLVRGEAELARLDDLGIGACLVGADGSVAVNRSWAVLQAPVESGWMERVA